MSHLATPGHVCRVYIGCVHRCTVVDVTEPDIDWISAWKRAPVNKKAAYQGKRSHDGHAKNILYSSGP